MKISMELPSLLIMLAAEKAVGLGSMMLDRLALLVGAAL